MLCAFCSFLVLPIPLFFYCCVNSDCSSSLPLLVGLTFHFFLILDSLLLFLLNISHFSFLYVFSASVGPFSLSFFPAKCLFVRCGFLSQHSPLFFVIFHFQHSSLFSCFFSAFPLLLTFEYFSFFMCLCSPSLTFCSPLSLHIFVHLCGHVCVFVTEGFLNPFPIGTERQLSK